MPNEIPLEELMLKDVATLNEALERMLDALELALITLGEMNARLVILERSALQNGVYGAVRRID